MTTKPKKTKAAQPAPVKSAIEYFDVPQGGSEWSELRRGIPTASGFQVLMARGDGKGRTTWMNKLAAEILTGNPSDNYQSADMVRGNTMEAEAREAYAFTRGVEIEQIGFIRNGKFGCSPDGLMAFKGKPRKKGLEIKTKKPELLIPMLQSGKRVLPNEHKAQAQGNIWLAEFDELDLSIYWPALPEYVVKVEPDLPYIAQLKEAAELFEYELRKLVKQLREMRGI